MIYVYFILFNSFYCFAYISVANYYTEKITLKVSTSGRTRVECRAFVTEIPELPCCTNKTEKSLCQPDTGIARVVVDILSENHVNYSHCCKAGVDLNSPLVLPLDDECPLNGEPQFCGTKSERERYSMSGNILGTRTPAGSSVASSIALLTPNSPGTNDAC